MQKLAGIVLAAGKGTRMKSALPKALHRLCGLPMAEHVGRAMIEAGVERPIMVVGYGAERVKAELGDKYEYVVQEEQNGTGHACLMALPALGNRDGPILVAPGDAPLITGEALASLTGAALEHSAQCALATCEMSDPTGYGRVVRDDSGRPVRIVEEADADDSQKQIGEVCTSFYCFEPSVLRELLPQLGTENAKGEQYLTDLIALIAERGGKSVTLKFEDARLLEGVNDRWQLASAAKALRLRVLKRLALDGVTVEDPDSTYVDAGVEIGEDTVIRPMTVVEGDTKIGSGCEIGPQTRVTECEIGDGCTVFMSHLNRARIGRGCRVGPFANLRPGTSLGERVKVGNYVEIKNAEVGEDASLAHLTYVGDATVGPRTNIGAGTIVCNYDGLKKHVTEIGADVFIGSNSTLVAPLKIGDGAMTAGGSVITEDVPNDALAIGRGRQVNKEGWAKIWRRRKPGKKS
ncbi:MAG: bifunctional UDP-N-acetylglucosamine diphosphorylase/glucosamine-1-phosphate N-acetyltransferase GlmU [Armatimonadetes bacterium]|nr:bifunctional UDP-N-acetylglucosamine diphosphorylase/glucosamine-1-phosphate N-acetyltransferase GlmU [Armatimonadota bacterium]